MSSSAAVGGLVLLCLAPVATATNHSSWRHGLVTHLASVPPGTILGSVLDERGAPVVGAMVSALWGHERVCRQRSISAVSSYARFLRVHVSRSSASRRFRRVTRSGCRAYVRADARHPRLLYGTRTPCARPARCSRAWAVAKKREPVDGVDDPSVVSPTDDHSELAWRLRHIRRGILKDAEVDLLATGGDDPDLFGPATMLSRAVGTAGPTRDGLHRRHAVLRTGQFAHDRNVRQPAATIQRR